MIPPRPNPCCAGLTLLLLVTLAACGDPSSGPSGSSGGTAPTAMPTVAPVPTLPITASAPMAPEPTAIVEGVTAHPTVARLIDALRERGITPRPLGASRIERLTAPGQSYRLGERVDKEALFLHVYPGGEAAQADAARIAPTADDGITDWIDVPHFFHCDTVIGVYLGQDGRVLDTLTDHCGPQFAGRP
ncbi:MAG: hypothetical protein M3Q65_16610 [Chloroflexota bacterium]|nr:hypothetical protein [Chloroflexota bacterium]